MLKLFSYTCMYALYNIINAVALILFDFNDMI